MMTVIIVIPVMTCISSLLFRIVKASCLGNILYEVPKKPTPDTWVVDVEYKLLQLHLEVKFNFLHLEINTAIPAT